MYTSRIVVVFSTSNVAFIYIKFLLLRHHFTMTLSHLSLTSDIVALSDDGVIARGDDRSSRGVFLLRRGAPEEIPGNGISGRHGEKQQQSETLLQVEKD